MAFRYALRKSFCKTAFLLVLSAQLFSGAAARAQQSPASPATQQTAQTGPGAQAPLPEVNLENSEEIFANINTSENEFSPVISPDGTYMLFNAKRGSRYQDIMISHKENGVWQKASPMSVLNSPYNDESPFISSDGTLILFSSDRDGSMEMAKDAQGRIKVSYDLYWSRLVGGKWSRPEPVPGVNTEHHEKAPSLSRDANTLYFSRWQWGNLESAKIYQAQKGRNGFENARPVDAVNTGHLEVILIPDERGTGFFFSAAREDSLGGFDIYYISYHDGEFGTAVNLGKPFNTEANEAYFSLHNGVIYFCSDRRGPERKFDIMASELPRENAVQFLIVDETSEPLSGVSINVKRPDGEEVLERSSNEFGRSEFYLNNLGSYHVFVEKPGYIPVYKNYSAEDLFRGLNTVTLKKLEEKLDFDFQELYFDTGSARIQERSLPFLKALAGWLGKNPDLKILIVGHTDSRGSEEYNMKLSLERAESVKKFLVEHGAVAGNLQTRGAGESQAAGQSAQTQARERKTEFILLNIKKNSPE